MMKSIAASPVAALELPARTTLLTSEELDGTLGGMPDPDSHVYQSTFETTGETVRGNPIDQVTPPAH